MAITFKVSPVERATAPLRMKQGSPRRLLDSPVEAWGSSAPSSFPAGRNALLGTIQTAFACHYPLVLTPDALWLCIAQGFAAHVNAHAERLRGKFVRHQGQVEIQIRRDDFIKGSPENPWPEVFPAFSDAIAAHIGRQRDLVVCDFSTTGPAERAASEVVLMAAMQKYFSYKVFTMCGIPEITLAGTVSDWRSIRRRAQALGEYELEWWVAALLPVIDQIIAAAEGRANTAFWGSLFKLNSASGGPYLTGWINVLFPYLEDAGTFHVNTFATRWSEGMGADFGGGPTESSLPAGLSAVPFLWHHLGQDYRMEFLGGFVGMAQDAETLALCPAIGWAVRDAAAAAPAPSGEFPRMPTHAELTRGVYGPSEVTLVAGRVSLGGTLTPAEVWSVSERLEQMGKQLGVRLECVVFGRGPASASSYVPVQGRLILGVRLGSLEAKTRLTSVPGSLSRPLEQVSAVTEPMWAELGALFPGGLTAESALYLVCYQDGCKGMLVLGEPTTETALDNVHAATQGGIKAPLGVRGVKVAEVSAPGSPLAVIDGSAAAEAERMAFAQAIGVKVGVAPYHLIAWRA